MANQDKQKTAKKSRRGDAVMNHLRTSRNKARNIKTGARRQERDAELSHRRRALRKLGALRRFERSYTARLKDATAQDAVVDTGSVRKLNATYARVRAAAA